MKKFILKKIPNSPRKQYAIDYEAELNPMQYQAATHIDGPHLVIAGAGTGKTRTLIYRLAYMVENNIDPQSILLLTFTRKASQEMMRRAAVILDDRCRKVAGGTFHSFANSILRKYALAIQILPNYTIIDRSDAEDIINIIRTQLGLNKNETRFPRKSTLVNIISKALNKSLPIGHILQDEYPNYIEECDNIEKIAQLFLQFKKQKHVMDYDDLLANLKILLAGNDEIRAKISNTYRYIMVDEYQDTNKMQAEIAVLLASEHNNIMVVGDDSQSIYAFRGADFHNIMDFPNLFPQTVITTLEQNYRSTQPILALTNAIIERAKEKYEKELFSQIDGLEKPVYIDGVDADEQAAFITQRILELREEGIPLNKIAVLFRSSWHSNELEVELKNANIPYAKYGGIKFAEAAHVKDVLAYIRVVFTPLDEIAWLRILLLVEGIGPSTASKITTAILSAAGKPEVLISKDLEKKKFAPQLRQLYSRITSLGNDKLTPAEKLEAILEHYKPFFEATYDDYRRRREDLNSLLSISARYSTLEQILTDMALEPPTTYQDNVDPSDKEDERLILSTIHSAKGLEWHTVFIIHMVDGYFPSTQSLFNDEQLEEERRLFYVAATRAQRNLYIITPELRATPWMEPGSGSLIFSEPSRFIREIFNFNHLTEVGILEYE